MDTNYRNSIATHGASLITHIGLVNAGGTEISSGGYARQAVTWTAASDGTIRPNANLVFTMTTSDVVAGWRGYSALSAGTNYGGAALTEVTFGNDGTYTLTGASSGITHAAA